MKVSKENDNNFGYEKITILVDNIPLSKDDKAIYKKCSLLAFRRFWPDIPLVIKHLYEQVTA
jgi:hypothetical protein